MKFTGKVSLALSAAFVLAVGGLAYFIQYFEVDASAETLLTVSNEKYIESQIIAKRYNPQEFVLIAYKPSGKSGALSTKTLKTLQDVSREIKKLSRVESVNSLVNAPIFLSAGGFDANTSFEDLTWETKQFKEAYLKKVLRSHPIYEGLLVSEDQKAVSLQVVFKQNPREQKISAQILEIQKEYLSGEPSDAALEKLDNLREQLNKVTKPLNKTRQKEIDEIRQILAKYGTTNEFYMGGGSLLAYQLIKIIKNDLVVFGGAILFLICLAFYFLFGSWVWVFLPVMSCLVCIASTVGALGLLGLKVTVISAHVISLQMILSLALIIHLIETYRELCGEMGDAPDIPELVSNVVRDKAKPCFYAGLTTSIGFGSLIYSGVQPVISFGWMMVLAIGVSLLVCLLFFPATLVLFGRFLKPPREHKFFPKFMKFFAGLVKRRPKAIIGVNILVSAAGLVGCLLLTAENSFIDYFSSSTQVYKELSFIDEHFGGTTTVDITLKTPETREGIFLPAKSIQDLDALADKLKKHPAIGNLTSVADFTKVAQAVRGRPLSEYEMATFLKFIDEDTKKKFLYSYFSKEAGEVRMSGRIKDATEGLDRGELLESIKSDIESVGFDKDSYKISGLFVLYQDILSRLVRSQFTTMGLVYFVMLIVLLFLFQSLKIALIALVPNLVTNLTVLGVMGFGGIPLDLMTMTIASVAMGISMDDTIHYIHRFLKEQKQGGDTVKRTNVSVGYALLFSTVVILVGFSALVFSEFVPSVLFGVLTAFAMLVALLADLTILPTLLARYCDSESN